MSDIQRIEGPHGQLAETKRQLRLASRRVKDLELALENALRCSAARLCGSCRERAVALLKASTTKGTLKRRSELKP